MARELTDLIARRGKPGMIVSDNGPEFTSHAIFAWAKDPCRDSNPWWRILQWQVNGSTRFLLHLTKTKAWSYVEAALSNRDSRAEREIS